MKSWVSYLMNASIDFADSVDLQEVVDLIESTPYGLIETVFDGCTTVGQVIDRALEILDDLDECGISKGDGFLAYHKEEIEDILETDPELAYDLGLVPLDDDPDWVIYDEIDEE